MGTFFLTLAVAFNSVANGLFKVSADIPDPGLRKWGFLALGLFIGLANTLCYVKALEYIHLGVAYPAFSAASIVLIALISLLFFHEGLSARQWAGLATICFGLLLTLKP